MRDAVAELVDGVRAECRTNTTSEVSRVATVEIEPHGTRELLLAVAPMEGTDGRWFLEVGVRRPKSFIRKWLMAGTRARVVEHLARAEIVAEVAAAARDLADTSFHTDGLPERW